MTGTVESIDRFASLAVGQSAAMVRAVTDTDILLFAVATGDVNPVHLDATFAARSSFGGRIAHGMLTAGFISATMATKLPGPGAIYLAQSMRFLRPVRIGDVITTHVTVLELDPVKRHVRLSTVCRNQSGKAVLDGEAQVLVPRED
jgi:3-hydroxybutyryl-CoA dehydratase